MRIVVVAVGKLKEPGLRAIVDEYYARVRRHSTIEEIELKDGKGVELDMQAAIPSQAVTVALEVGGQMLTSEQLADRVAQWGTQRKGVMAFLIGGADGLPSRLSGRADVQLSLSRMTMAHRVARVVLAEQIYRAVSIWRHEPYHRG